MKNTITNQHPTLTIELVGSYIAIDSDSGTAVDLINLRNRNTTKSPIPILCRQLIKNGVDPETRVHVIRRALDSAGYVPVFKRDRRLGTWADVDCVESSAKPLHTNKHKPFPSSIFTKEASESLVGTLGASHA